MQQGDHGYIYRGTASQKRGSLRLTLDSLLRFFAKHRLPLIGIPALALIAPTTIFAYSVDNTKNQQQNSSTDYVSTNNKDESAENNLVQPGDQKNTNSQSATVTINGETITIPSNGQYHTTIIDDKGTTSISSKSSSTSSSDASGTSNTNSSSINISTNSSNNIRSP